MKKLIYVQDDFLDPKLCKPFIDLYDKSDSFLETVTHSCLLYTSPSPRDRG